MVVKSIGNLGFKVCGRARVNHHPADDLAPTDTVAPWHRSCSASAQPTPAVEELSGQRPQWPTMQHMPPAHEWPLFMYAAVRAPQPMDLQLVTASCQIVLPRRTG